MDIIALKYFVNVCKNKNFTKSANELFITQQALSRIIGNLEKELGAAVFHRNNRGVTLTQLGEYLYPRAKEMVAAFEEFEEEAYSKAIKEKMCVKIGFSPGTMRVLGAREVLESACSYANVDLEVSEHSDVSCETNVLNGNLDTAFTINPRNDTDFDYYPLIKDHFVAVMNKNNPLSKRPAIQFEDLRDEKLILLDDTFRMQLVVGEHFKKAGFTPRVYSRCNHDLNAVYDFVVLDKGIFIFVNSLTQIESYKEITSIPIDVPTAFWDIGFILKKGRKINSPLKKFMNYFLIKYQQNRMV